MRKSQHTREYQRLIEAVRRTRENAGLTQEAVAEQLAPMTPFISKIEAAERRIDVIELVTFCRIYGVDLADFLRSLGLCS